MLSKESFILFLSETGLVGAVCRVGLNVHDVLFLQHVPCADQNPETQKASLRLLLNGLREAGCKRPDEVRVCLPADKILFRDWAFPFRSRIKTTQALSLLLDAEFPFDASILAHRVCLTGTAAASTGFKHGAQVISASIRREELDCWLDLLEEEQLFPRLVTVDPFPLFGALPQQTGISLLLHVRREGSTVALLDKGTIRRIRTVSAGWMPVQRSSGASGASGGSGRSGPPPSEAENPALRELALKLRNATELILEGLPFVPERLLAYGEVFFRKSASTAFAEAFALPITILGQELPLAGQMARLGETDPWWQMALCVAGMPLPSHWRPMVSPSFHRAASGNRFSSASGKRITGAVCGIVCVSVAALAAVWAEGYANNQKNLFHEEATRSLFRKALPESRGSFSPSQMESILKARIAERSGNTGDRPAFPVLHLLQAMHAAVPPSLDIRVDRLSLDTRRCGLSGTASGYEQVNSLRGALTELPGVRESKILSAANTTDTSGASAGAVLFEIELTLEGDTP